MFQDIAKYWGATDPNLQAELMTSLCEKKYTKKHLNVDYRWLNYWDTNKLLLSESSDSGKWRKFSFVDYIWMEFLRELRAFGVSAKKIKPLREKLSAGITFKEMMLIEAKMFPMSELTKNMAPDQVEFIKQVLENPDDFPELDEEAISVFGQFVMGAIASKALCGIALFKNGDFLPYFDLYYSKNIDQSEWNKSKTYWEENRFRSHIFISITDIFIESIKNPKINPSSNPLAILTEDEYEVLNNIRSGTLKSLKIRFNGSEISMLELTEEKKIDMESRFLDEILKKGYQTISFSTQEGRIVSFENTRKIKPKSTKK